MEEPAVRVIRPSEIDTQPWCGFWRSLAAPKPTKLLTKIHGKWYDVTEFEKWHPGGPVALGLARGRDATIMFESNHQFTSRSFMDAILAKYEVDDDDGEQQVLRTLDEHHGIKQHHEYEWPSAFGEALIFEARQYFQSEAKRLNVSLLEATKATPARWREVAVMAALYFATFPGFFRGDWWCMVLFPLIGWVLTVNTFHDAAHFAMSSDWRVNALLPYLFPYFISPFTWYIQHNIGHHNYTNIVNLDPDLQHFQWLKREHRDVQWAPFHYVQSSWLYLSLYWMVAVEFGLAVFEDLWMVLTNVYNGVVPMVAVSGARRVAHTAARLVTVAFVHAWPYFLLGEDASRMKCFLFAVVPWFIYSFLFMMNTQINHLTPATTHHASRDYYKHELMTGHDFGLNSRFCYLLSGGLNHQAVHHLFPAVNSCHLPHLQPMVARLALKHDVAYCPASGYLQAIARHHEHSRNLSFNRLS